MDHHDTAGTKSWRSIQCAGMTETDRKNQMRFVRWTLAWAIAFVLATFLLEDGRLPEAAAWLVALAPSLLGLGAIGAYFRFLRDADELLRKIQLESLALAFGAGMLFMLGYRLHERAGAPGLDMNDPLLVMCLVWAGSQMYLNSRYS
jgi:hypothetical protein